MSSPIWTPAALSSERRRRESDCWRLVEAQHRVSTLKLTDTLAEQALLEDLLEETKPRLPPEAQGLHYLMAAPFRYGAPYPIGSRFRRAGKTLGVFYGAERPQTAAAEIAFHRLLFYAESPGTPWPANAAEYTAFNAPVRTSAALDLTLPPLDRDQALWTDLRNYEPCQALAEAARSGPRLSARPAHARPLRRLGATKVRNLAHKSGTLRRPGDPGISRGAARIFARSFCRG